MLWWWLWWRWRRRHHNVVMMNSSQCCGCGGDVITMLWWWRHDNLWLWRQENDVMMTRNVVILIWNVMIITCANLALIRASKTLFMLSLPLSNVHQLLWIKYLLTYILNCMYIISLQIQTFISQNIHVVGINLWERNTMVHQFSQQKKLPRMYL